MKQPTSWIGAVASFNAVADAVMSETARRSILFLLCAACVVAILPVPSADEPRESLIAPIAFIAFARVAMPLGLAEPWFAMGIPILAAIPEAVRSLQELGMHREVQLIVSGGIRNGADAAKALALGADAVSIGVGAIVALGDNSHEFEQDYDWFDPAEFDRAQLDGWERRPVVIASSILTDERLDLVRFTPESALDRTEARLQARAQRWPDMAASNRSSSKGPGRRGSRAGAGGWPRACRGMASWAPLKRSRPWSSVPGRASS